MRIRRLLLYFPPSFWSLSPLEPRRRDYHPNHDPAQQKITYKIEQNKNDDGNDDDDRAKGLQFGNFRQRSARDHSGRRHVRTHARPASGGATDPGQEARGVMPFRSPPSLPCCLPACQHDRRPTGDLLLRNSVADVSAIVLLERKIVKNGTSRAPFVCTEAFTVFSFCSSSLSALSIEPFFSVPLHHVVVAAAALCGINTPSEGAAAAEHNIIILHTAIDKKLNFIEAEACSFLLCRV